MREEYRQQRIFENVETGGGEYTLEAVVRSAVTRLAAVSDTVFTGSIGEISSDRLARLKTNLAHWIDS